MTNLAFTFGDLIFISGAKRTIAFILRWLISCLSCKIDCLPLFGDKTLFLKPFYKSPFTVFAEAKKKAGTIHLTYTIKGPIQSLRWPCAKENPTRQEGLWQGNCFEAFLAAKNNKQYLEINLSPSGDYAYYLFTDYRQNGGIAALSPPAIKVTRGHDCLKVQAHMNLGQIEEILASSHLEGHLTACLLEQKTQSHWAKEHASQKPDFHQRCFLKEELLAEKLEEN